MIRTKQPKERLPDAVNGSPSNNFSIIQNDVIRNPNISAKAKAILFILLSNQEGWVSHISAINSMMKEGSHTIQYGLKELEDLGYLARFKYRDKITKSWIGSFWSYTTNPGRFRIKNHLKLLDKKGWELVGKKPEPETPITENPYSDNPYKGFIPLIIPIINNIKKDLNNNPSVEEEDSEKSIELFPYITKDMFDKFYKIYPKKKDKGAAKAAWDKTCILPKKTRPTWEVIETAVLLQKKTRLWTKENGKYIKFPATWLNKNGWLNDPEEMNDDFELKENKFRQKPTNTIGHRNKEEYIPKSKPDLIM
jgi:hypothetical protein